MTLRNLLDQVAIEIGMSQEEADETHRVLSMMRPGANIDEPIEWQNGTSDKDAPEVVREIARFMRAVQASPAMRSALEQKLRSEISRN